jgi:hypothetical protein
MLYIFSVINCTSPHLVGVLKVTAGCKNYYGGTCNFTCPIGYRLVGMPTLTCVTTNGGPPGVWDGAVPKCEGVYYMECLFLKVNGGLLIM